MRPRRNRWRYYKYRLRRKVIALSLIVLLIALAIQAFFYVERHIQPTLLAIAEARSKVIATKAINDAITKKIAQNFKYDYIITVHTNHEGDVSWAQVNTMEVNRLASEAVTSVAETLESIRGEVVRIPLGQALNSKILGNRGPRIPITIVPVGTVTVEVINDFQAAGINQTRHKIYLEIHAQVQIVIPFVTSTTSVRTLVPVAEATYFGEVPETVIDLPSRLNPIDSEPESESKDFKITDR